MEAHSVYAHIFFPADILKAYYGDLLLSAGTHLAVVAGYFS